MYSEGCQIKVRKNDLTVSDQTRNNYIDFLRGIAALGIIAIHTAFWGGQGYTPAWFQNLTLFLDVPFFFYLSGWASSYRRSDITKTGKGLLKIWFKWIFFITVAAVFCAVSVHLPYTFQGVTDIRDLANNYMFTVSISGFPVVAGSIWFMPYYMVVLLVNAAIMMIIERSAEPSELKKTYMWLLLAAFIWIIYGKYAFGLDLTYFLFYSFFWMLGVNRLGRCAKPQQLILCIGACIAGVVITSYLQGLPLYDIQSAKFPPSLKYGFVSMVAILIAKYFDGRREKYNKFLLHIGKNVIWYYFGQGIGSSINFYVINLVSIENWFLKWLVTYAINVVITIAVSESLAAGYKYFINGCSWVKIRYRERRIAGR